MRHKCSFYQAQGDREPCTFNIIFDMGIFQFITTWTNSSFISQIETGTCDARQMLRHWSCMSSGHLWVFPCPYALSVGEKTSTSDQECSLQQFFSPVLCFVKSVEIAVVVFAFREFPVHILPPVLETCSLKARVGAISGSTVRVHCFLDIAVLLLSQDHCL